MVAPSDSQSVRAARSLQLKGIIKTQIFSPVSTLVQCPFGSRLSLRFGEVLELRQRHDASPPSDTNCDGTNKKTRFSSVRHSGSASGRSTFYTLVLCIPIKGVLLKNRYTKKIITN